MAYTTLHDINKVLLFILLFFGILYLGRPFLIPIAIAALFAIMLLPVSQRLEKWGMSRAGAAALCVVTLVILILSVSYFLTDQVASFVQDLPAIKENLDKKMNSLEQYINSHFDLAEDNDEKLWDGQVSKLFSDMGTFLTQALYSTGAFLADFFIVAVYCFFFINYRRRLRVFILQFLSRQNQKKAQDIFLKIAVVANSYIVGVSLVVLILSVCNTIALSIIGVRQALFFGLLAGILNIIPWIGSLVGSAIPVLVLLITRDSLAAPVITAVYFLCIQLVESYLLTPNITGNKVKLNPMATVLVLLLGALIWGVAGMILFIPFLGIFKVLFDNIEPLQPFGYIVGNQKEENVPGK